MVAGEDDGVGRDELHAVFGFFVAHQKQVDAPAFDEVFEAFGVVASAPGHQVCAAGAGLIVIVVKVSLEDVCVEAGHCGGGGHAVGAENRAAGRVDFERDGHAFDEVIARGFHGGCIIAKDKLDGVVVDVDAAHAIFEDACIHELREFMVAKERVDVLWVAGFEVGDAGERAIAHVHAVHEAIRVNDFVEREVRNVGICERRANVSIRHARFVQRHAGLLDEFGKVDRIVVKIACGDEFAGCVDFVDGTSSARCGAIRCGSCVERVDHAFGVLELEERKGQGGSVGFVSGSMVRMQLRVLVVVRVSRGVHDAVRGCHFRCDSCAPCAGEVLFVQPGRVAAAFAGAACEEVAAAKCDDGGVIFAARGWGRWTSCDVREHSGGAEGCAGEFIAAVAHAAEE